MKYLEHGHTYMRADLVNGSIGRRMSRCPEVMNFDEFVEICDKSEKGNKIYLPQSFRFLQILQHAPHTLFEEGDSAKIGGN